jgi:hypothetical protein
VQGPDQVGPRRRAGVGGSDRRRHVTDRPAPRRPRPAGAPVGDSERSEAPSVLMTTCA